MTDVRIVPLCGGAMRRPRSSQVRGADDELVDLVFTMFYVRADGHHILVDTGAPRAAEIPQHQPVIRDADQDPGPVLAGLGLGVEDIDIVINTHLHWDHCANNAAFPNATIYAQRSELQYAIAPLPPHRYAYDQLDVQHGQCVALPPFLRSNLTLVDGDVEVSPSVRLLHTPGHSPGSQSVVVAGQQVYALPGDNVPLQENLPQRGGEPDAGSRLRAIEEFTINTHYTDLEAYFRSMARTLAASDVVLPSHDSRVFDRAEYR